MGRKYVLRVDFDEIDHELWTRVQRRVDQELPDLAEEHRALTLEEFQPIWDGAVDRILDEELAWAERRLEAVAGWLA